MIDRLKQEAMQRGMKLMSNPRVMKVMADPRVMKMIMQAFQLRGRVQAHIQGQTERLARTLGLATKEEVSSLKATLRSLEGSLCSLEQKVDATGNSKSSSPQVGAPQPA